MRDIKASMTPNIVLILSAGLAIAVGLAEVRMLELLLKVFFGMSA